MKINSIEAETRYIDFHFSLYSPFSLYNEIYLAFGVTFICIKYNNLLRKEKVFLQTKIKLVNDGDI